ncbi:hypothetical protein [Sphingomonas albertensis]
MGQGVAKIWTAPDAIGDAERLSCAVSMIAARNALHGPLPSEILHDPALGILLQLFVASSGDQYLSLSQLSERTNVSRSVALRWLKVLEYAGTVSINDETADNPTPSLSAQGVDEMNAAMSAVINSQITLHGQHDDQRTAEKSVRSVT